MCIYILNQILSKFISLNSSLDCLVSQFKKSIYQNIGLVFFLSEKNEEKRGPEMFYRQFHICDLFRRKEKERKREKRKKERERE
jgi:hypothetical protein